MNAALAIKAENGWRNVYTYSVTHKMFLAGRRDSRFLARQRLRQREIKSVSWLSQIKRKLKHLFAKN